MLAKGQADMEPEAAWQKEAGVHLCTDERVSCSRRSLLDCIWYFLSSSKPDPPRSDSGHFCSGYLQRGRPAGEN